MGAEIPPDGRLDRLELKVDKLTDGMHSLQVSMERNRGDLLLEIQRVQSRDDVRSSTISTKTHILWTLISALGAGLVALAAALVAERFR